MTGTTPVDLGSSMLDAAARARTLLASLPWLTWDREGDSVAVPFVEEVGSPMLLVSSELRDELIAARRGRVENRGTALSGALRLTGEFWPVAEDASLAMLRALWAEHESCPPSCSGRATHLVGMRVDRVELVHTGRVNSIDVDAYQLAHPDLLVAQGLRLASHLNSDHLTELIALASRLDDTAEVLVAQVDWVDSRGITLTMIDQTGSHQIRRNFRLQVLRPADLIDAVHDMISPQEE